MTTVASNSHRRMASEDRRVPTPRQRVTSGPLDPLSNTLDPLSTSATLSTQLPPAPQPPTSSAPTILDPPLQDLSHLRLPTSFHPLPTTILPSAYPPPSPSIPPSTHLSTLSLLPAALSAQQTLLSPSPLTNPEILNLWYIRLLSLTLLGAPASQIAAQESTLFQDIPGAPWELRVLLVKLQATAYGDWKRAVTGYYELAREARGKALDAGREREERKVWRRRLGEVRARVAGILVEAGDEEAAVRVLEGEERWRGLVLVKMGRVDEAGRALGKAGGTWVQGMIDMMQGRWEQAEKEWRECGEDWGKANWAVCLLYQGKLKEAREALEELIEEGKSWPAIVFNLATVYELCGDGSRKLKTELAGKVAKTGVQMNAATFKV